MDPFVHLPEYRLVVCTTCQFACVAGEVTTHLRTRHVTISPARRRQIAEAVSQLGHIIRSQAQLGEVRFPPPSTEPIPCLGPPRTDGLRCRACAYIVCDPRTIKAHCRSTHGWKNPRTKGRPPAGQAEGEPCWPWTEGVQCQRFFHSRGASRWFEVGRGRSIRSLLRSSLPPSSTEAQAGRGQQGCPSQQKKQARISLENQAYLNTVLAREERYIGSTPEVCGQDLGNAAFVAAGPWMDRTRWPTTYKDVRRDILLGLSQLPDRRRLAEGYHIGQAVDRGEGGILSSPHDEQKLSCLVDAVGRMLDRCEETVRHTSRSLLCWLRSFDNDRCVPRPFSLTARDPSRKRYWRLWKRCIVFVFRSCRLLEVPQQSHVGCILRPNVRRQVEEIWTHRVWGMIDSSRGGLPNTVEGSAGTTLEDEERLDAWAASDCSGGSSDSISWEQGSETDDDSIDTGSLTSWGSDDGDDSHDESDEDPDPASSSATRETATALDEMLQLLFRLSITLSTECYIDGDPSSTLLVYFSGILGFSVDSKTFLPAKRYTSTLSGLIYVQLLLFLERALPLQAYEHVGIPQRPHANQHRQLNAMRKRYIVKGCESPFDELRSLRDYGKVIARTDLPSFFLRWSDDGQTVSYGDSFSITMEQFRRLADYFITAAEQLSASAMCGIELDVDLTAIKDDMANIEAGFSFVKHPENELDRSYLDLVVRASTCGRGGLLKGGKWNQAAVIDYQKRVTVLEQMLVGGLYTACGQAPRSEELLHLLCENGPSSPRSIYVWNGSMIYVTRHHKAKRITNREFFVVRFLPARLARVLFYYMVSIRRVAELLRRE